MGHARGVAVPQRPQPTPDSTPTGTASASTRPGWPTTANSIAYRRTPAVIGTGWLSHYPVAQRGYAWQHRTIRHSFLWWDWTETVTDTAFYVNNGWGGGGSGEWIDASTWFAGEIYP